MSAPYRKELVDEVDRDYPHLLRANTKPACGEFMQRVVAHWRQRYPADRPGLLTKPAPGQPVPNGFTFPNGQKTALDVVAFPDGSRVDVINSSGAGEDTPPKPGGTTWIDIPPKDWRASDVWIDVSDWPIFDSHTSTESGPATVANLGIGIFPAIRAAKEWLADLKGEADWVDEHLFGKHKGYARVFADVEGSLHARGGNPDPWRDAGCDITARDWEDDAARMLDFFGERDWKVLLTMYGSPVRAGTRDQRRRNLDRLVRVSEGRWQVYETIEGGNEWWSNHWPRENVVDVAQLLRAAVPSFIPVAVSTPELAHATVEGRYATNEEMADAIAELYGWATGDMLVQIGVHLMRGDPSSKWADPFGYNGLTLLDLYNGEPFGPGASAGGDIADVAQILGAYQRTGAARWKRYTTHCACSVFMGRVPAEYNRPGLYVRRFRDHDNMEAICHALREYRATGKVVDIGSGGTGGRRPVPVGKPRPRVQLEAGEVLAVNASLTSPNGVYNIQLNPDGNLVIYAAGKDVWASNTVGSGAVRLVMQSDGNLVLQDAAERPVWHTATHGHAGGAMCQIQDDGNFVVYEAGVALWASRDTEEEEEAA